MSRINDTAQASIGIGENWHDAATRYMQERDRYKAHAEALAAALRSSIYCKREDVVRVIEQAEAALAAYDKEAGR